MRSSIGSALVANTDCAPTRKLGPINVYYIIFIHLTTMQTCLICEIIIYRPTHRLMFVYG